MYKVFSVYRNLSCDKKISHYRVTKNRAGKVHFCQNRQTFPSIYKLLTHHSSKSLDRTTDICLEMHVATVPKPALPQADTFLFDENFLRKPMPALKFSPKAGKALMSRG